MRSFTNTGQGGPAVGGGSEFRPGESTSVRVVFEAVPTVTRVTVHHSGWAKLRADHPVRHGKDGPSFIRMIGLWWGDLMTSFRELAAERLDRVAT